MLNLSVKLEEMSRVKLGKILPSKGSSCDPKQKKPHNLSVIMVI